MSHRARPISCMHAHESDLCKWKEKWRQSEKVRSNEAVVAVPGRAPTASLVQLLMFESERVAKRIDHHEG